MIFLDSTGKEVLWKFSGPIPTEPYLYQMQEILHFVTTRAQYKKNPEDLSVNLMLAIAYLGRKQLELAQPMIQRVLKADPDNKQGWAIQVFHFRAIAYVSEGNLKAAEKDIEKVRLWDKAGEHLPGLYFQIGFELGNQNQFETAAVYFEKVCQEYPDSPPADASRYYRGLSYFILKKGDQALPLLRDYAKNGKDPQLRQHAREQIKQIQNGMQ